MKKKTEKKPDKKNLENPLQCSYCEKTFRFKSEKSRHELSHSTRYKCKVCNKEFGFISALRRHEKQHERCEAVQCLVCRKKFKDEALLQRHIKYAHGETYACQYCEAEFFSHLALRNHEKCHKPASERVHHCDWPGCNKTFNFAHHLKHHQLVHEGRKQYYCNVCSKGFIQRYYLKTHLKSHEPENWLECNETECTKKFVTEYALRKHLARHNRRRHVNRPPEEDTCKESIKDVSSIDATNIINVSNLEINKLSSNTTSETADPEAHGLNDCKTALGACIVTGDAGYGDDYVCAKIPNNSVEVAVPYEEFNTINETRCNNECNNENCSRSTICASSECYSSSKSSPQFEYGSNGAVKLINTFDFDANDITETNNNEEIHSKIFPRKELLVPYNSCKAVLGNCIVSGDGTMAEGCLCARMSSIDSQDVTEQQMSELTIMPSESVWD